jgi:hypothetical protein
VAPSPPVDTEDSDDPTADNYVAPWHSDPRFIPADVRFVVAWWLDEPETRDGLALGQTARADSWPRIRE